MHISLRKALDKSYLPQYEYVRLVAFVKDPDGLKYIDDIWEFPRELRSTAKRRYADMRWKYGRDLVEVSLVLGSEK